MSRVAKSPVALPKGVEVTLGADSIAVKGKNGNMSMPLHESVEVKQEDGQLVFAAREGAKKWLGNGGNHSRLGQQHGDRRQRRFSA